MKKEPLLVHMAFPCTQICVLGKKGSDSATKELVELVVAVAKHQRARGRLFTVEQPRGTAVSQEACWKSYFGNGRSTDRPVEAGDFDRVPARALLPWNQDFRQQHGRVARRSSYRPAYAEGAAVVEYSRP